VRHRKEQERTEEELRRAKISPDALCFVGNLGRLMNEKKVNGAELGRQIGKTKGTVYGYMERRIRCRFATVLNIAAVLGCEPYELITEE
jgi:DNA-binding Xre family transcriptional regulator